MEATDNSEQDQPLDLVVDRGVRPRAPKRDLVERLRHIVPEHGWAVVNKKTDGIVIWFSERQAFHSERKARAWLQEHAETHRTHEVRPYEDACLEHEAADEIELLRAALQFYAAKEHFILSDAAEWDTVSGEPQNWWCDGAGTATVEDGSIAAMALRGEITAQQITELEDGALLGNGA